MKFIDFCVLGHVIYKHDHDNFYLFRERVAYSAGYLRGEGLVVIPAMESFYFNEFLGEYSWLQYVNSIIDCSNNIIILYKDNNFFDIKRWITYAKNKGKHIYPIRSLLKKLYPICKSSIYRDYIIKDNEYLKKIKLNRIKRNENA